MQVTFTKVRGRRYVMEVVRDRGPVLAPRQGPGYDDYLPHDAVHLIVESEAGLTRAIFGQVAAGRSNIFWPTDPADGRRQRRREAKRRADKAQRSEMARSELLASVCPPLWELRTGRRDTPPVWFSSVQPEVLALPVVDQIILRLDDFATRWRALPAGGNITLSWPLGVRAARAATPLSSPRLN